MVTIVTAQGASGVGSHDVTLTGPWMESVHEEVRKSLQLLHPQQQVVVKNPPKKPGEDDFTAGWNLQIPITYLKRKESMIWTKPPWGHVPAVNLQGFSMVFPMVAGYYFVNLVKRRGLIIPLYGFLIKGGIIIYWPWHIHKYLDSQQGIAMSRALFLWRGVALGGVPLDSHGKWWSSYMIWDVGWSCLKGVGSTTSTCSC